MRISKFIFFLFFISACNNNSRKEECQTKILDLSINEFSDSQNKLISLAQSPDFKEIIDSVSLIRYEASDRMGYLLETLPNNPSIRKYTFKVKENIIKTDSSEWDLILLIDNSEKTKDVYYSLNSYNNKHQRIDHLDLAFWSLKRKAFVSAEIYCDSTINQFLSRNSENRKFKIIGNNLKTIESNHSNTKTSNKSN